MKLTDGCSCFSCGEIAAVAKPKDIGEFGVTQGVLVDGDKGSAIREG